MHSQGPTERAEFLATVEDMSNLIPVQRTDRNGKTVTRWVRNGADGKPAPRGIPAPTSKSGPQTAMRLRLSLFPRVKADPDDPTAEYAVNIHNNEVFYSPQFAQQSMERLPVRTLRLLEESWNALPEDSSARSFVAQHVYDYIREMYDMGGTAATSAILKAETVKINNACVFAKGLQVTKSLSDVGGASVSQAMSLIDAALRHRENNSTGSSLAGPSVYDYSLLPKPELAKAQNYVLAFHLNSWSTGEYGVEPAFEQLVADNRGNWERMVEMIRERGISDLVLLQEIIDSETPALSAGAL